MCLVTFLFTCQYGICLFQVRSAMPCLFYGKWAGPHRSGNVALLVWEGEMCAVSGSHHKGSRRYLCCTRASWLSHSDICRVCCLVGPFQVCQLCAKVVISAGVPTRTALLYGFWRMFYVYDIALCEAVNYSRRVDPDGGTKNTSVLFQSTL